MHFKLKLLPVALGIALATTGCFHDTAQEEDPSTRVQLSGVASKGIIMNGLVKAHPVENGTIDYNTVLAETRTDQNGRYELETFGYAGPVSIVVSPAPDGLSFMKCDVQAGCTTPAGTITFGSPMGLNFSLEAIVPNAHHGDSIQASVTPLTNMAAEYAKNLGVVSPTTAGQGVKKVEALFEVDNLLSTPPVDITDSSAVAGSVNSNAVKVAAISAAIANVAQNDAGGDIKTVIENLSNDFATNNGELVGQESVDDPNVISFKEITEATVVEATGAGIDSTSTIGGELAALDTEADSTTPDQTTDNSTEITQITSTDVDKAKLIVSQMTTWATTLSDIGDGVGQFDQEVMLVEQTVGDAFSQPGEALGYAMEIMGAAFSNPDAVDMSIATFLTNNTDYFMPRSEWDPANMMFVDVTRDGTGVSGDIVVNGNNVTITNGMINGATINLSLDFPASLQGTSFTAGFTTGAGNTIVGDNATVTIRDGSKAKITFGGTVDLTMMDDPSYMPPEPTSAQLDLHLTMGHNAAVTNGVTFNGDATMAVTFVHDDYDLLPNPSHVKLAGNFGNDNHNFDGVFEGFMRNHTTFKRAVQTHQLGETSASLVQYEFNASKDMVTFHFPDLIVIAKYYPAATNAFSAGNVLIEWHYNDGGYHEDVNSTNELNLEAWLNSYDNWIFWNPVQVDNVGGYQINHPAELADGSLDSTYSWAATGEIGGTLQWVEDIEEDATHWRDIDGKLTFIADTQLPDGTPVAQAKVVLSADRFALNGMKGNATFTYNGFKVAINVSFDDDKPGSEQASLVIEETGTTNKLAIYPSLNSNDFVGTVKVGSNIVGKIYPDQIATVPTLRIDYIDGTFETIVLGSNTNATTM